LLLLAGDSSLTVCSALATLHCFGASGWDHNLSKNDFKNPAHQHFTKARLVGQLEQTRHARETITDGGTSP